ncbi:hypothetical protein PMKS-001557 [Pichia membranifaciens]|uniref:SH3 domain-containing protein n=1 Tax=Pichia membranifaciens TaxID=4926 RepID=A0A1Q2YEX5_9ASCO|nr:hypothetical protein PMKS-001557 [Pichia membranifaciens]
METERTNLKTPLPRESQDIIVQDIPEGINQSSSDTKVNNLTKIAGTNLEIPSSITTANNEERYTQDQMDPEVGKLHTTSTKGDSLDDSSASHVNVKDFAYALSDPKHFGIYLSDDEEEDEEDEVDADDDHDYGHDGIDETDLNDSEKNGHSDYYTQDGIYQPHNSMAHTLADSCSEIPDSKMDTHLHTNEGRDYYGIPRIENGNNESFGVGRQESSYPNDDENNHILHAVALYEFTPENSNELPLIPEQLLIINYECGDGWLVAHDPFTGQTGLVPSEYIRILEIEPAEEDYDAEVYSEFAADAKDAQRFMPEILADDSNGDYPQEQGIAENISKLSI